MCETRYINKLSKADILKAYQAAEGLSNSEMSRALGISRQLMGKYIHAQSEPDTELVMTWFTENTHNWVREMALDMFKRCYADQWKVPCVCQTEIGDNGPCPRHAATLVNDAGGTGAATLVEVPGAECEV